MDQLDKLLEKMEQGSLVPNIFLEQEEIETALNKRDDSQFANRWMEASRKIEMKKQGKQDAEPRVGRLRELAYLQAYERWKSPDLAAYISDDFGLIGDGLATESSDVWLVGLLNEYLRFRFPTTCPGGPPS